MIKTFIYYCSSLLNHTRFQTKTGSLYQFRPKRRKNLDLLKVRFRFLLRASLPAFCAHAVDLWQVCKKPCPLGRHNWAAHTYMSYIREYPPPPEVGGGGTYNYASTKITLRLSFKIVEKNTSKSSGSVVCILASF